MGYIIAWVISAAQTVKYVLLYSVYYFNTIHMYSTVYITISNIFNKAANSSDISAPLTVRHILHVAVYKCLINLLKVKKKKVSTMDSLYVTVFNMSNKSNSLNISAPWTVTRNLYVIVYNMSNKSANSLNISEPWTVTHNLYVTVSIGLINLIVQIFQAPWTVTSNLYVTVFNMSNKSANSSNIIEPWTVTYTCMYTICLQF